MLTNPINAHARRMLFGALWLLREGVGVAEGVVIGVVGLLSHSNKLPTEVGTVMGVVSHTISEVRLLMN